MSRPAFLSTPSQYSKYLLVIAGLGGLLYGIDVGIIAGALPFLEATSGYSPSQLSTVVAAVLLGSVLSSLFAGALADLFGRKAIMLLSALLFVLSIPIITLSQNINILIAGRLLQGISGGLIGVVIPLYLAECLGAQSRGKGTGMFQFMLTVGLVASALIALFVGNHVDGIEKDASSTKEMIFAAKNSAWRTIFWISIVPGIIFMLGACFVSESPRWLLRSKRREDALNALRLSFEESAAQQTLSEMEAVSTPATAKIDVSDHLLQRKYVIPFILALITLACTQATGINSILAYAVNIFQQAGLRGTLGNQGNLLLTIVNCAMTVVAVMLVDRKGRTFLLKMGTSGIMIALFCAAMIFRGIETKRVELKDHFVSQVNTSERSLSIDLKDPATRAILDQAINPDQARDGTQIVVSYKYGPYTHFASLSAYADANEAAKSVLEVKPPARKDLEDSVIGKFFRRMHLNPFPDMTTAEGKPLELIGVRYGAIPSAATGWAVVVCLVFFIASFASGPGVCVWLALSELMPNRIRSNGMSIALLVNQGVSTTIAAVFLPTVGRFGYSSMFFFWAGCTVIYFITAAFFLPETKGKTLEEIEDHFAGKSKR